MFKLQLLNITSNYIIQSNMNCQYLFQRLFYPNEIIVSPCSMELTIHFVCKLHYPQNWAARLIYQKKYIHVSQSFIKLLRTKF